jgi:heptosyltransferase-2
MKILVIQQKMIGDVLTSTIICESLKKELPDCEVHYMIHPNTFAVVERHPHIDKILFFDPKINDNFFKIIRFGQSLKSEKYDVVIDAYGKWESVLVSYFSGANIRIGFKKWYTSIFFTKTIVQKKVTKGSAVAHRLQLVESYLNKEVEVIYPKIYLTDSEIEYARNLLKNYLKPSHKVIMVSVLGSGLNKSLPFDYMAKTIDIIAKEQVQLLFNFMPNQKTEAQQIYDLCTPETQKRIIFDFDAGNLRRFLAVLSQCDALIGNEGGAVNMAKALGIKTFSIYSPWINKSSWNMLDDGTHHVSIHLNDYYPEIYNGKHPKKFKSEAFELYKKLKPDLYSSYLKLFIKNLEITNPS